MTQKLKASYAITHEPDLKGTSYLWSAWKRKHWPIEVIQNQEGLRLYGFNKKTRKCFTVLQLIRGDAFSYKSKTEFSKKVRALIQQETSGNKPWLANIPDQGFGLAITYKPIDSADLLLKGKFPRLGWKKLTQDDFVDVPSGDFADMYEEGQKVWRKHLKAERSSNLRGKAKAYWEVKLNGKLRCCVCRFDFSQIYPGRGENFIELHHEVPVSAGPTKNRVQDLVPLCSNCHRMIHRDPNNMLTTEELRLLWKSST
ncbi:HNH endonuclease [Archangium sp.]|uniref:HNH endonuclease n=1 Tax=Archangium sp. TaxID=1872627 RepID=UPI00389AC557